MAQILKLHPWRVALSKPCTVNMPASADYLRTKDVWHSMKICMYRDNLIKIRSLIRSDKFDVATD